MEILQKESMMDKYRIAKFYKGKYGYKSYMELQQYNSVYDKYYSIKNALALEFIESYCLIHKIDYSKIPVVKITKSGRVYRV